MLYDHLSIESQFGGKYGLIIASKMNVYHPIIYYLWTKEITSQENERKFHVRTTLESLGVPVPVYTLCIFIKSITYSIGYSFHRQSLFHNKLVRKKLFP